MNKMKELAQLLGVELGEEFELDGINDVEGEKFKLTYNDGLIHIEGWSFRADPHTLERILLGVVEIKAPLLTEVEKEYLENVLRPFKDRVDGIKKTSINLENKEFICVTLTDNDCFMFPYFKQGEMYKRMEANTTYTLEELRLFEDE